MKKLLFAIAVLVAFSGKAYAIGSYTLVSGPSVPPDLQNGWYSYSGSAGQPTIKILSGEGSSCGGTGTWTTSLGFGGGDSVGEHTVRIFFAPEDSKSNLWVSRDGVVLGTLCNQDTTYSGSTTTVWEGVLKFDLTSPRIEISDSLNNTNTNKGEITVTGTAYDVENDNHKCLSNNKCSVIKSVTVNGVNAQISGDTFSAVVTVNKGLNTITAFGLDNAGRTSNSSSITVFRSDEVAMDTVKDDKSSNTSSQHQDASPTTVATNAPTKAPSSSNNDALNSDSTSASSNVEADTVAVQAEQVSKPKNVIEQIPVPVKAAGSAAGVGVVALSYLGYIPYKKIGLSIYRIISN